MDDIPEALRDTPPSKPSSPRSLTIMGSSLWLLIGISVLGIILLVFLTSRSKDVSPSPPISSTPSPSVQSTPSPKPTEVENVLGHLPYQEAPAADLVAITSDNRIRLRKAAARKFQKMQAAARKVGVSLVPLSGFRSMKEQEYLFFEVKAQRNQETKKRAEVSAPPGYSEHHTGYAIDIGDGNTPASNLSPSFENTAAFYWLKKHAAQYSFELSFGLNNPQGISYEPWHWRYVGDTDSLETFYKAKQLSK